MKRFVGKTLATFVVLSVSSAEAGPFPSWDQVINKPKRFQVLADFNNEAVLDKETGLVWEKSPSTALVADWDTFLTGAVNACYRKVVGGRMGWRLPKAEELYSLADPAQTAPALPPGHPFENVPTEPLSAPFWSATTLAENPNFVIVVQFHQPPDLSNSVKTGGFNFVWCVRGGHGYDAY